MYCYGWSILALQGAIPAARRAALFSIAIYFARFRAWDREIAIFCPGRSTAAKSVLAYKGALLLRAVTVGLTPATFIVRAR